MWIFGKTEPNVKISNLFEGLLTCTTAGLFVWEDDRYLYATECIVFVVFEDGRRMTTIEAVADGHITGEDMILNNANMFRVGPKV
jgi:hypothetical protein